MFSNISVFSVPALMLRIKNENMSELIQDWLENDVYIVFLLYLIYR